MVPTDDPDVEGLRPADILLSAAPLGGAGDCALDAGVTNPCTAAALASPRHDAVHDYYVRKVRKNEAACKAAGWEYRACVVSCFGRASGKTGQRRASRRQGARMAWRGCLHGSCVARRRAILRGRRRTRSGLKRAFGARRE